MRKLGGTFQFLIVFAALTVLTQLYQNCGQVGLLSSNEFASLSMGDAGMNDQNHPAQSKVSSGQRVLAMNKTYVAELVREVFTSANYPVPALDALINQWILYRGAQYGVGCNPYDTYSTRDCGGGMSGANLPYHVDDNTVRESFRIQFCEHALGTDNGVNAVLEKVSNRSVAPTAAAIAQIYLFFYRGDEAPSDVIASLLDMDVTLAKNNESVINRWRAVILQICESPGWQLQ